MTSQGKLKIASLRLGQFNWASLLLAALTFVIGVMYIWQVNVAATRGFAMRDLEQGIEELRLENDRLHMQAAELRSIDSVSTRMQMLGLTEVSVIEYVMPGGGSVAINR